MSIKSLWPEEDGEFEAPVPREFHGVFTDLGEAEKQPPEWIVKDLLPVGMTVLGGPPKTYKSTMELALALLTAGYDSRVLPAQFSSERRGLVLMFSYEASAGELRFIAEENMGQKIRADESILVADDPFLFRLDDPDGISKLLHWLEELEPMLVCIDPLRDFHSLDENDSGAIIRALRPLQQWAKKEKKAVLVVHHTKKRDEGNNTHNDWRGTSALLGMVDGCLTMTRKGNETVFLSAAFKRGESWQRTIQLGVYGRLGMESEEEISELDRAVYKLLKAGAPNVLSIAQQVKAAKGTVISALRNLERNGLVTKEGKKWKLLKKKK